MLSYKSQQSTSLKLITQIHVPHIHTLTSHTLTSPPHWLTPFPLSSLYHIHTPHTSPIHTSHILISPPHPRLHFFHCLPLHLLPIESTPLTHLLSTPSHTHTPTHTHFSSTPTLGLHFLHRLPLHLLPIPSTPLTTAQYCVSVTTTGISPNSTATSNLGPSLNFSGFLEQFLLNFT